MLKKIVNALAIVVMSLSFSYGSFTAMHNSGNNVYASSKNHKKNSEDEGFWQKVWDGLKYVQE